MSASDDCDADRKLKDADRELLTLCSEAKQLQSKDNKVIHAAACCRNFFQM